MLLLQRVGTGIQMGWILQPACVTHALLYDLVVHPVFTAQGHHLNKAFDTFTILKRPYMLPCPIE